MTVYVDDARIAWRGRRWCHLQADTLEELHAFAANIGLKREWFQEGTRPEAHHYDVSETVRSDAIKAGAHEETTEEGSQRRRLARGIRVGAAAGGGEEPDG